ncbi:hypothetical protein FHX37_2639 [Haloactinospora alba]|uniref:TadE-like protein n=1 Tax=Haloactinospora alba TaxID=405555 RepID=A0A543NLH4_9ACTN|nr:hypothetical protein [Haloactinospora alba]TQN32662.1 hypothetical protein FHX37_2639 [Haloactinospora alba]
MRRSHSNRSEQGQVTAFAVTVTAELALLFALVYEGGQALAARSSALFLAQEAARAGAQQLDLAAYRAGEDSTLAPRDARHTAQAFLEQADANGTARVEGDTVTVTARTTHTFTLVPVGTRTLEASASASPHTTAD